jgi:predicted nucleotidyltransferase
MAPSRETVFQTIDENAEAIRALGVKRLSLFGSCARGDGNADSDLDFVVSLEHKTFDAYMDTKLFLESIFNCGVDLVLYNTIKPRLRERITAEMIDASGL